MRYYGSLKFYEYCMCILSEMELLSATCKILQLSCIVSHTYAVLPCVFLRTEHRVDLILVSYTVKGWLPSTNELYWIFMFSVFKVLLSVMFMFKYRTPSTLVECASLYSGTNETEVLGMTCI